ncbi:hypothetical protein [uncultured Umboniibacter sp.]|uniref:hypothetical protein n=1 Tax=uncultured Umboniibacter sp. TaxID=1798917 RepID=UPI002635340E|nr:hypothetical protein [uncultured Umboniibacter sp.]
MATVVEMCSNASALDGRRLAKAVVGSLCQSDLLIHAVSQPFIEGLLSGLSQRCGDYTPRLRVVVLTDRTPSELAQQRSSKARYIWMISSDSALRTQIFNTFESLRSLSHLNVLCGQQGIFDLDTSCHQDSDSSRAFMLVPSSSDANPMSTTALSLSPSLWDTDLWLIESSSIQTPLLVRIFSYLAIS